MTTVFCSSSAADHYDAPTLTDLLVRLLVLVALACQPDAHAEGGVAHALRPQVLVKLGVEAHVLRLHRLLRKLAELADGARRALLEGCTVQPLVKVDGVLARDQVGRGLLLAITLHHPAAVQSLARLAGCEPFRRIPWRQRSYDVDIATQTWTDK